MKTAYFTTVFLIVTSFTFAQTLYIPTGTGGIGSSTTGNVGVFTNAPQGHFQVNSVRPILMKNNGGNGIYGSEIGFNAILNTSVVPNQFKKLGGSGQYGGAAIVVDYRGNMFFQMYDANTENESIINYSPQITFQNSGKVGLGTTTPQALLNVNLGAGDATVGTAAVRIGGTTNYPSLELGIKGAYDGMITTFGNDLHIYAGNMRVAGATATENHNISFYTSQAGSANWNTPKVYLRYDGNLGIGTTTPDSKLTVKGNIHAEEVRVDLSVPGPDYVFSSDYELPTLEEIKAYIDQHQHLPEVPSAKEMEANGVKLGEMNMVLLKKIEELTLYAIEFKTEIDKLKTENKKLKDEMNCLKNN